MAGFYESFPVETMPAFEIPAYQYGSLGVNIEGRRNNYSLLEPFRAFFLTGYYWMGLSVPPSQMMLSNNPVGLNPFQQIENAYRLPKGSWVLGFAGFSTQAAGFRFQVWDVGAKDYVLSDGWMANQTDAHNDSDADGTLTHWLPAPYYVVSVNDQTGGLLQVKLVNSAAVSNDLGLIIHCACPIPQKPKGAQ